MANEEQPIERVRVVYVVSRVIEFIDLANGDTLADRLRQLHELILRDKAQSKANLAQTTVTEGLPALKGPALQSWQKTTSRRVLPVVRHSIPVENRYAALGESQGLCGDGCDDVGSYESSGSSSAAAKVLDWLRVAAGGNRRRNKPRQPAAYTTNQDLVHKPGSAPVSSRGCHAHDCKATGDLKPRARDSANNALLGCKKELLNPACGENREAKQKLTSQDALREHLLVLEDQLKLAKEQQQGKVIDAASAEMKGAWSEMRQLLNDHDILLEHILSLEFDMEKTKEELSQLLVTELTDEANGNSED